MKKIRLALAGLALLIGLGAVALALYAVTFRPAQRPASTEVIDRQPLRLARGQYLVTSVLDCFGCHSDRDWKRYAGPLSGPPGAGSKDCLTAEHGAPGRICFPNITPDLEAGLGRWTDGEILRALREGVDKDGKALFPMMPYHEYSALSDEDARAVVAYLRILPAVRNTPPVSRIDFPVSVFMKLEPRPLPAAVPVMDPADRTVYGWYLATVAGCAFCHTPVDGREHPIAGKEFAGGHVLKGPWGAVRSSNLTPHATGLGARTREELIGQFRAVPKGGHNTPMPWLTYAGMTDADLGAIYDYLRTVPAVDNRVEKYREK